MGYDLHKYERFHTFNVVPAGATSELAVAVNKAGHIVQASEVRAEAIPYCGLQGSLDAIKSAYATYPIGTLASVRNSDNLYQKTAEGVWTQITIPAKGGFTAITANGQAVSDTNPAILRWHYQVPLTYLNATNNGQDSNRFSAKYLGVDGVSGAINQFVSATDNIYNNAVSSGYDVKITKAGTAMNKGESEANDQWMDSPYSGMILFMKQQATGSDIRMTCFEYVGKTVQEQLNNIKVEASGGIKGITLGTGITIDANTEGGLKPTVSVDTSVIATKLHVKDSIEALDSTSNGSNGISVVQTDGVVSTTVTPAAPDLTGYVSLDDLNRVVTAEGAQRIADKSAADKIATELTAKTGSIAQAIEQAKITVKTGSTSEDVKELTLTDTSTSTDDVKISITPQSNTASDGKLNLKISASTSTLAKKADKLEATGYNTTVAEGTAPEVKVVLGGTVSSPSLTVTATDVASASTLAALSKTVTDHIAAKGGAITIELAESLESIENPSSEVIYLIPVTDSEESNVKDEYIYVNNQFEKIGSTKVDLTDYATKKFVTDITDNKADKSTTYTKTEVDTALGKKADKNAVVSSLNDMVGAIQLDAVHGLYVHNSPYDNTLTIRETTFDIYGALFEGFTSDGEITITPNTLYARASTELFPITLYINTQKLAAIERSTCPCEILVVNVDLPACTTLSGVTVGSKVSCPNLVNASAVKLATVEAMLYLVDSLLTLSTPNNTQAFYIKQSVTNEDIDLFNELNAELKAKGWTTGVTLTDDLGQSVN